MIEVLETDPHFREKLQTANTEDIKVIVHQFLQVEDPSMMRTVGQTADRVLSSSERTSGQRTGPGEPPREDTAG